MQVLLENHVDGLLLETFYDLEEAVLAAKLARKLTDEALIVNVSLGEIGVLNGGIPVSDAFEQLIAAGADVVGLNCRMVRTICYAHLNQYLCRNKPICRLIRMPACPTIEMAAFFYNSNPDYFANMGVKFIEQGVRLLGGCCGTTPEQIKAFAKVAKNREPITEKKGKAIGRFR